MSAASLSALIAATSTDSDSSGLGRNIFYVVAVVIIGALVALWGRRRARATVAAATDGAVDNFAFVIAPAPPIAAKVAELRALLGAEPLTGRLTRYSRIAVTANATALTISEKKLGPIVVVPVEDIASLEMRIATFVPHGVIIPRKFPAVWLTVRHNDTEIEVALTPIVNAYDKVSEAHAEALANELRTRLAPTPQPTAG